MSEITEQIDNALAALRPETRCQMIKELDTALLDTKREYLAAQDNSIKSKLLTEVTSLDVFLKSAKKVEQEYANIRGRQVG